jgi:hypothetical protein
MGIKLIECCECGRQTPVSERNLRASDRVEEWCQHCVATTEHKIVEPTPVRPADEGFEVRFTPKNGPRRREVYSPTGDGQYLVSTERREGSRWHHEGAERVRDVDVVPGTGGGTA